MREISENLHTMWQFLVRHFVRLPSQTWVLRFTGFGSCKSIANSPIGTLPPYWDFSVILGLRGIICFPLSGNEFHLGDEKSFSSNYYWSMLDSKIWIWWLQPSCSSKILTTESILFWLHDFDGLRGSQWKLKCESALVPLDFVRPIILHKKSKN